MILIWATISVAIKIAAIGGRRKTTASAEAFFWLGRSYYELRDFDNAVVHAEKAVALDDKNSSISSVAGARLWRQSRPRQEFFSCEKSEEGARGGVRLNPSNIEARFDLEDFCHERSVDCRRQQG